MTTFTVGQIVWMHRTMNNGRMTDEIVECVITDVKRKWVSFHPVDSAWDKLRFDQTTPKFEVDGGNYISPGAVYVSKQKIECEMERKSMVKEIRTLVFDIQCSNEDLKEAIRLLKGQMRI